MQKDLLEDEYKFSILIPTWNNMEYLKLTIVRINKK